MLYAVAMGVVLGGLLPPALRQPTVALAAMAAAGCAAGWLGSAAAGRRAWLRVATACLALAAGAWNVARAERLPAIAEHVARLPLPWRGAVAGVVAAEPVRRRRATVLTLDVTEIGAGTGRRRARGRVRLRVRGTAAVHPGDRVAMLAALRRPRGFRSLGAFAYESYLARRGIHVTGSVDGRSVRRLATGSSHRDLLGRWRRRVERVLAHTADDPERAVLRALVLGRSDALPERLRDCFVRAGVAHVLVVSGLHVSLVAALGARLAWLLMARSERLLLAVDARALARVAGLLPVAAYTLLVGPSVSIARASVMAFGGAAALCAQRAAEAWRLLALAALAVALVWPGSPSEAGFQLSFASVAGVLAAGTAELPAGLASMARPFTVAAAVTVVTGPVVARHFDALAPMGVVANPLVVPLFGVAVLGPSLLAAALAPLCPTLAAHLFALAACLLHPGLGAVRLLGGSGALALPVPRPSGAEVVALYAVLLAWRWRCSKVARVLAVVAAVGLAADAAYWVVQRTAPGRLRAAFLDVGQGDATVIELPDGRVLVMDAGGFPGSDFDPGRAVVEPYLRTRKIARIDVLAMSHAHPDHAVGLARLVERFRPREFWWAGAGGEGRAWRRLAAALRRQRVPIRAYGRGDVPQGFGGTVRVLHPSPGWRGHGLNDLSLVLAVGAPHQVLLTGDVEERSELALLGVGGLRSTLLKVPHHGSRTSSTTAWVAAVDPAVAVISVGADNPYGLPAPEVERRYRGRGACVLRTDECGTVVVDVAAATVRIRPTDTACACAPAARQLGAPSPLRSANITSPTRSRTPSFWKMFVRWVFTVRSLMRSVSPTSLFL